MKFDITAKATGKTSGEIMIYGYIADYKWDDDDVTAKDFDAALKKLGAVDDLMIRVNSYGGSVFAGQAIVSMIDAVRAKGTKVTSKIEGIGASMGSSIPQAADRVIMASNAMMMIHKPSSIAWGNADAMRDTAEMLDKAEKTLIALYMRRFKGTEDELRALLKGDVDGTWLTADEALAYGLCDEIDEPVEMAACAGGYRMNGIVVPTDALKGAADKIQIHGTDGGENEMLFNKETDAKIKAILDSGKAVAVDKDGDNYVVSEVAEGQLEATSDFLTAEQVQDATYNLQDASAENVLLALKDIADAGIALNQVKKTLDDLKKPDPDLTAKAEKYDAIFAATVQEAIKHGVQAKGNDFDGNRWQKILDGLTLDEVKAQGEEWLAEAEAVLGAGRGRMSRVPDGISPLTANPDDYKNI